MWLDICKPKKLSVIINCAFDNFGLLNKNYCGKNNYDIRIPIFTHVIKRLFIEDTTFHQSLDNCFQRNRYQLSFLCNLAQFSVFWMKNIFSTFLAMSLNFQTSSFFIITIYRCFLHKNIIYFISNGFGDA